MTLACPTCPHYADCYRDGACSQATRRASGGVDTAVLDGVMREHAPQWWHRHMIVNGKFFAGEYDTIVERYRRALTSAAATEVGACRQPETGLPRTNNLAAGVLAASVALFSWGAHAAPPPEGSPDWEVVHEFSAQIMAMRNQQVMICCDSSDARPVPATHLRWHIDHEEVFYNQAAWEAGTASLGYSDGVWLPVPDFAPTTELTPVSMTMVWILDFGHPFVRCIAKIGAM